MLAALLRWQPWISRLQLPIFLLGIPLIGVFLSEIDLRQKTLYRVMAVLFIVSTPLLIFNDMKPLLPVMSRNPLNAFPATRSWKQTHPSIFHKLSVVLKPLYKGRSLFVTPREELYFLADKDLYDSYRIAANQIQKEPYQEIGLFLAGGIPWEYPLWVLTDQHAGQGHLDFNHAGVKNFTRFLQVDEGLPKIIFSTANQSSEYFNRSGYRLIREAEFMKIYKQGK
jgi:hypothetical protein